MSLFNSGGRADLILTTFTRERRRGAAERRASGAVMSGAGGVNEEHRHGVPCSPEIPGLTDATVLVRYMFDGSKLSQGRLLTLEPHPAEPLSLEGIALLRALASDGVDLRRSVCAVTLALTLTLTLTPVSPQVLCVRLRDCRIGRRVAACSS